MATDVRAFTTSYTGISNVLKSNVEIGAAFDPSKQPLPQIKQFEAIWDTGASASVISDQVARACGLQPTGMTKVYTASGVSYCNTYLVCIMLPNRLGFPTVRVTEGKICGADALIGMDIIGRGDFAVSNFEEQTVFTYRNPSVCRTDYVEAINRSRVAPGAKVGRNDPCPCGSGRKAKKCCFK